MSNKKQAQKDRPQTANPAHPSKLPNAKKGSGNPKERNNLQANQEKQPAKDRDNNSKVDVKDQSEDDVNGNNLEPNLRNAPAH